MHDTDEGIMVLPIHLSGVKSDENVGGNRVFLQESCLRKNASVLDRQTFPGAYESCNFAESCRYGDKRGDCMLHSCFARWKRLHIVDLVKNSSATGEHVCVILCVFSLLFSGFFLRKR